MSHNTEILIAEVPAKLGKIGQITLNRPKALNALSMAMCEAIYQALGDWQNNPEICAVLIKSAGGRAFCAGGDIRALYQRPETAHVHPHPFFWHEYRMNARLFHFTKPYISLLDGVTMGGGAGISIHGSHPVATERLMFAMPETGIGFFPDIGASEFLLKCPGRIGWYLALTGNIIAAHDAFDFGLISHVVPSEHLPDLERALFNNPIQNHKDVTEIINQFHVQPGMSDITEERETLDLAFSQKEVHDIVALLHHVGSEWARNTANMVLSRSPTSLKVTYAQLERAKKMTFDDKIKMDFDMTQHFLEGHDFLEGIRAVVIDKDNRPKWQPAKLDEVSDEQIQQYFTPIGERLSLQ